MDLLRFLLVGFKIAISATGLLLTFYAAVNFTVFLSYPQQNAQMPIKDDWETISWSLFTDMFLMSLFILQHSLMVLPYIKKLFNQHFGDLQRSVYVIGTSITMQLLMNNWRVVSNVALWRYNLTGPLWWTYVSTHVIAWMVIYVGSICMDINELIGIKQVYYSINSLPNPLSMKSFHLQKLYTHMRHPGFVAFLLLFWVTPVMCLDRLLLASIFSTYMYVCWKTDQGDCNYQKRQHERKYHELDRLH